MQKRVKIRTLLILTALVVLPGCTGKTDSSDGKESTQSVEMSGSDEEVNPDPAVGSSSELESVDEVVIQLDENEGVGGL